MIDLFYRRINIRLAEIGHKRPWLLAQAGIKPSTWSSWERNSRVPPADRALAIAEALGVSVEYLLTGKETAFDMRQSDPLVPQIFNQLKALGSSQLKELLAIVTRMRLQESQ